MNFTQWLLVLAIVTLFLVACQKDYARVVLEAESPAERKEAIKYLSDQALLVKITLNDKDESVRKAAFEKLNTQNALEEILLRTEDWDIFENVLEKISDQKVLEKAAFSYKSDRFSGGKCKIANKLKSRETLQKLAFEDWDWSVRRLALDRLLNPKLLTAATTQAQNCRGRLFTKLVMAFDEVPVEEKTRLMSEVMPGFRVMSEPEIVLLTGEILYIKASWKKISAHYSGDWNRSGDKPGEVFSLSLRLQKIKQPVTCEWATKFEYGEFNLGFKCAEVEWKELLSRTFVYLPLPVLTELVRREENDSWARFIAIEFLTDQSVLTRIAKQDKDSSIREEATTKLTDQTALADIAILDGDSDVRLAASKKLTEQAVLSRIATQDKDHRVRLAATELLTNQTVLTQVAQKDEDPTVRSVAVMKLMDQKLLEKIIKNEKDEKVLGTALYQLGHLRASGNGK